MPGSIEQAVRNGSSHSAGRLVRVALPSRNQMEMRMHHFLSRDDAAVGADVEPQHRLVALEHLRPQLKQQLVGVFRSWGVMEKKSSVCRRVITSKWPSVTGYLSLTANTLP